ncbi:MAG: hypothetical protein ACXABY_07300 [Candidatus Thorarchaeota archaeon]|jgi:hypothetical protein
MYKLTATKTPLSDYAVSVSKEGSCVEDHFSVDASNVKYLITECKSLLQLGCPSPTLDDSRISLDLYGNAYQMVVRVSKDYVKAYILNETEIKLFQASLKRAIDG